MPLFLIGAGFNADAKREAGPIYGTSIYIGKHEIDCDYPLISDLAFKCFNLSNPPTERSIEDLFDEALAEKNYEPIKALSKVLMRADSYIVPKILPSTSRQNNCYAAFFSRFQTSSFLTFNYDSLVEAFLLRMGRWRPSDGYGFQVHAWPSDLKGFPGSESVVLHLHGSLCIYPSDAYERPEGNTTWVELRDEPLFVFDPDACTELFRPFGRESPKLGYRSPEERIIAPVPDKAEGLREDFVLQTYEVSRKLLRNCEQLIVIGYSFNPLDQASYDNLLKAIPAGCPCVVIAPEASDIVKRLSREYPKPNWKEVAMTFKNWVVGGFPGLVD